MNRVRVVLFCPCKIFVYVWLYVFLGCTRACVCRCDGDVIWIGHDLIRCSGCLRNYLERDMGLYEVPLSMSLVVFGMGTMLANFHMCGVMLVIRAVYNMLVTNASPGSK